MSDNDVPRSAPPPARVRTRHPRPEVDALAVGDAVSEAEPRAYAVGYGKPPKAHRFQPGQSGNPKGRPKGSRSISTILSEELDKPISARTGGRTVTMSRRQALVRRLLEQALSGDLRALALLIKLDSASDAYAAAFEVTIGELVKPDPRAA